MNFENLKRQLPDTILTDRLELRAPAMRDAETLQRLADNEKIHRVLARLPHPYTHEDAVEFIAGKARSKTEHAWAIDYDGGLVGVVGLSFSDEKAPELGYWLGEPFWGQGFATECAIAVLEAARAIDSSVLIVSRAMSDNTGSCRVLTKAGFVQTGEKVDDCGQHKGVQMTYFELPEGEAP